MLVPTNVGMQFSKTLRFDPGPFLLKWAHLAPNFGPLSGLSKCNFPPPMDKEAEILYKVTKQVIFQMQQSWFTTSS